MGRSRICMSLSHFSSLPSPSLRALFHAALALILDLPISTDAELTPHPLASLNSLDATTSDASAPSYMIPEAPLANDIFSELDFNNYFGIVSNEDLVIIRPYADDEDDRILEEIRPKYVVMYDPNPAFVRRLEVSLFAGLGGVGGKELTPRAIVDEQTYRAAHANLAIRVYFLTYKDSVEEQRYLSSIRKEKDAFEKLIREKGVSGIFARRFPQLVRVLISSSPCCADHGHPA